MLMQARPSQRLLEFLPPRSDGASWQNAARVADVRAGVRVICGVRLCVFILSILVYNRRLVFAPVPSPLRALNDPTTLRPLRCLLSLAPEGATRLIGIFPGFSSAAWPHEGIVVGQISLLRVMWPDAG